MKRASDAAVQNPAVGRRANVFEAGQAAARKVVANADVLEVIAEYACAIVTDACALRAANKGYRRAVDTTVRHWVYANQPLVRTSPATILLAHQGTAHLDIVRIAFTCDVFKKIARLVVVAFALDGAKDELREAEECGPRPVASSYFPIAADLSQSGESSQRAWTSSTCPPVGNAPALHAVATALLRCVTTVHVQDADLTVALCDAVAPPPQLTSKSGAVGCWRCVRHLTVDFNIAGLESIARVARLLDAVGPQLTHLTLPMDPNLHLCSSIARCTSLQHIECDAIETLPTAREPAAASEALCDALVRSGAPLRFIATGILREPGAVRLLEAAPTIDRVRLPNVSAASLPPTVVFVTDGGGGDRDRWGGPAPDRCDLVVIAPDTPVSSAAHVATKLSVVGRGPPDFELGSIATLFPHVQELTLFDTDSGAFAITDAATRPAAVVPAAKLRVLSVTAAESSDAATRIIRHICSSAPPLVPPLVTVHITLRDVACATVDITPLTAVAGTLTALRMDSTKLSMPGPASTRLARLEATLSHLVSLEQAELPLLPSARAFVAGLHVRLRDLTVAAANAESGVQLPELLEACPRLVRFRSAFSTIQRVPVGWVRRGSSGHRVEGYILRQSFV